MTQATPYIRQTGFADDERDNAGGRSTIKTADLDAELDAISVPLDLTISNLAKIQRDDGILRDGIVPTTALGSDTLKLLTTGTAVVRGTWTTATVYAPKDLVTQSGNTYICAVAHTSGVFATDLAAVRWVLFQIGTNPTAAAMPFSPTANILSTNVQAAVVEVDTNARALYASLASVSDATKAAGAIGFNYALTYTAGTIGKWLQDLSAANVGYNAGGSAGSTRTIQSKLREIEVSLTDKGCTGVGDETTKIQAAIDDIVPGQKLVVPGGMTFSATKLSFTGKTDFTLEVRGKLVNIASKPGAANTDLRGTAGGLQTFIFSACTRFQITGTGSIQNGFREALYISNCTDFDVALDCLGNGTNDNLVGIYLRYCSDFAFHDMTADGVTLKPTNNVTEVYNNWGNNFQIWDCSDFSFIRVKSNNAGMNGFYPASNCTDFTFAHCVMKGCAASGIQPAWSSFGTFPLRFTIAFCRFMNNQADGGPDINNTSGANVDIHATIHGNTAYQCGWINGNPANGAGVDGSGVGTFFMVNRWAATSNHAIDCAGHGVSVINCNNYEVTGSSINKSTAGVTNSAGCYVSGGTSGSIAKNDVKVGTGIAALVTQSMNDTVFRDNSFDGLMSFSNGSYLGCKFVENKVTAPSQVQVQMDFLDNNITVSGAAQNGLLVGNPSLKILRNTLTATSHGIVNTSINYTEIGGNVINVTGAEGILVTSSNSVSVQNNDSTSSANAAGIRLTGTCDGTLLAMNRGSSTGGGNSILVDSTCTLTQKFGNRSLSGAPSFLGTYGVNF